MLPEGHGRPRAFVKEGPAAPLTNGLLENGTLAIEKLWKQRGYDPKKPDEIKARLGYRLDTYEAAAYLVTGAIYKPRISQPEAWTIGKRIQNIIGTSGPVGVKLKKLRKKGRAAASQVAVLLRTAASLNLVVDKAAGPPTPAPTPAPAPQPAPEPVRRRHCLRQPSNSTPAPCLHMRRSMPRGCARVVVVPSQSGRGWCGRSIWASVGAGWRAGRSRVLGDPECWRGEWVKPAPGLDIRYYTGGARCKNGGSGAVNICIVRCEFMYRCHCRVF